MPTTTWCDFCYALEQNGDIGQTPEYKRHFQNSFDSRTLYISEQFLAIAGLGPLAEGYTLLLPKEHCCSLAHLPRAQYDELEKVSLQLRRTLTRLYCPPIIFEHGPMPHRKDGGIVCEGGGSCMDHAHLHFLPWPGNTDRLASMLRKRHPWQKISHLSELEAFAAKDMPYIFLETSPRQRWVFEAPSVPSQYMRRLLAEALGEPEQWNWHFYPGVERVYSTVARFRSSAGR